MPGGLFPFNNCTLTQLRGFMLPFVSVGVLLLILALPSALLVKEKG
jgi:hypothetical protein